MLVKINVNNGTGSPVPGQNPYENKPGLYNYHKWNEQHPDAFAFLPNGEVCPDGGPFDAEVVWQYKIKDLNVWKPCSDNNPEIARSVGLETRRVYLVSDREDAGEETAEPTIQELQKQIEDLKQAINIDRTGLAKGLAEVRQLLKGYTWVTEGRGPYAYDDEAYKGEVLTMINQIDEVALKALQESGALATNAFHGLFENTYARQQENGWVKKIDELRNKLYETVPAQGTVTAFELVKVIKEHITELDKLTNP